MNNPRADFASGDFIDYRFINPLGEPRWEEVISEFRDATFVHTSPWTRVLQESYGFSPQYLVGSHGNGDIASILPVMEVSSWLTPRRGVSLPFTDECGTLGYSLAEVPRSHSALLRRGRKRKWKYLELRGTSAAELVPSTSFWGHRLDLNFPIRELFSRLYGAARTAVRKAARSGVTCEVAHSLSDTRDFYGLTCKTRKRHGIPPQPFNFFENIHRHILTKDLGMLILAKLRDATIGGALFCHFRGKAIYKYAATDERYRFAQAGNLVLWRAIELYAARGLRELDFGRTSLGNEGLRRFKESWGALERKVSYFRYNVADGSLLFAPDRSGGFHTKLFRIVPIWLSRAFGSLIYRHIA